MDSERPPAGAGAADRAAPNLGLDTSEIGLQASERPDAAAAERGMGPLLDRRADGGDPADMAESRARLKGIARLLCAEPAGVA